MIDRCSGVLVGFVTQGTRIIPKVYARLHTISLKLTKKSTIQVDDRMFQCEHLSAQLWHLLVYDKHVRLQRDTVCAQCR